MRNVIIKQNKGPRKNKKWEFFKSDVINSFIKLDIGYWMRKWSEKLENFFVISNDRVKMRISILHNCLSLSMVTFVILLF